VSFQIFILRGNIFPELWFCHGIHELPAAVIKIVIETVLGSVPVKTGVMMLQDIPVKIIIPLQLIRGILMDRGKGGLAHATGGKQDGTTKHQCSPHRIKGSLFYFTAAGDSSLAR
jgi:hypothetical protein